MNRKRLISLDVFRGITIAGMILVNMAGVAPHVYPALEHAEWHGYTPTDAIFPFFLFIIGVAIAFSFAKYVTGGKPPTPALYGRILRRSAILFLLGLLLNGFYTYDFSTIRAMGVLQRIGLAYLLSCAIVLHLPRKWQWRLTGIILVGYWLAMNFIPVPGYGAGVLTPAGNFAAYVDRILIGKAHLYAGEPFNGMGDPEGLFSTLPAVATVLIGYFAGGWLRDRRIDSRTSMDLIIFGLICLAIGQIWDFWFPINKSLWTSSYVLFTAGWALLLLAACYEAIEVRSRRGWSKPFEAMGANAIVIFVASVLLIKILVKTKVGTGSNAPTTYNWIYEHWFVSWAGGNNGSLFFAIATLLLWWMVAYGMYRRGWFVKVY